MGVSVMYRGGESGSEVAGYGGKTYHETRTRQEHRPVNVAPTAVRPCVQLRASATCAKRLTHVDAFALSARETPPRGLYPALSAHPLV